MAGKTPRGSFDPGPASTLGEDTFGSLAASGAVLCNQQQTRLRAVHSRNVENTILSANLIQKLGGHLQCKQSLWFGTMT